MNLAVLGVILWLRLGSYVGLESVESECSHGLVWREAGRYCAFRAAITRGHSADDLDLVWWRNSLTAVGFHDWGGQSRSDKWEDGRELHFERKNNCQGSWFGC